MIDEAHIRRILIQMARQGLSHSHQEAVRMRLEALLAGPAAPMSAATRVQNEFERIQLLLQGAMDPGSKRHAQAVLEKLEATLERMAEQSVTDVMVQASAAISGPEAAALKDFVLQTMHRVKIQWAELQRSPKASAKLAMQQARMVLIALANAMKQGDLPLAQALAAGLNTQLEQAIDLTKGRTYNPTEI